MCSGCSGNYEGPFDDEDERIRQETLDVLGQDIEQNVFDFAVRMKDLKTVLEIGYARYMRNTTFNLVGHIQQSSPLVGKRSPV